VSPPRRLDRGAMRLALQWAHGISEPLRVDPAKRSLGGSRQLDRRRKEGEAPRRPHGGGLRPPRLPTVHATDPRNRRYPLGSGLTAVGDPDPIRSEPHSIRRSAWKNSTNFAFNDFSEVAPALVPLHTRLRCLKHGGAYESRPMGKGGRCRQKQESTPSTSWLEDLQAVASRAVGRSG
jgi:hypothetical protein